MKRRDKYDYEIIYEPDECAEDEENKPPEFEPTKKERVWVALGALKSALLIGMVYLVGFGILIALLSFFWK